jgi:LuxR family maltose regulon positive regulatory protein
VYEQQGQQLTIPVGTPPWYGWLETATAFSFVGEEGTFTAHKMRAGSQRGSWYWRAYRRQRGRLSTCYLGISTNLTLSSLRDAARRLTMRSTLETSDAAPSILLLNTKFALPRLPVQHVSRPRLLTLLTQNIQRPFTLISAPAGSGKTTLLAEWASTTDLPVAWISLEAADNDPARFLAYLMTALTSLDTHLDNTQQPANAHNPEDALTSLLNDLNRLLQQDAVLILDDYHLLTTNAIHELLRFLLDHLPTHLHLILGTRIDPPLSLARLRANNQMSEVRAETLRFITDEVETLASLMGLVLSNEATNLLEQRTEGWIAGVQLLTLALRGKTDATAFLETFHGTHRFLLDYVIEEVLAQQTPDTQHFLLRTCILSRMTGPLCDAVTELPDGQNRLTNLLKANLFVSTLDDTEIWYRYHPLFAEALRTHLQKLEPELLPELYLRASRWHEQHRHMEEACDYALLANDFPRAAYLMAELLPRMIDQGRFEQLHRWLDQLPPALIAASPQLSIVMPWMRPFSQNIPQNTEQAVKRMEQQIQKQDQDVSGSWEELQGVLTLFQALTAMSQNKLPRAFSLIHTALQTLTRRGTSLSLLIARFLQVSLSVMHGASGDVATAEQILLDLQLTQPEEPLSVVRLAAMFLLGELYNAQGRLHKAEALYENPGWIFEPHVDIPPIPLLLMGFSLMRKTTFWYEWNCLQEATQGLQQVLEILPRAALETTPHATLPLVFSLGLWMQARIEWAQGHSEMAKYHLEQLRKQAEIPVELPPSKERPPISVPTLAARLALICDQEDEAIRWEKICDIHFDDTPTTLLESRQVFLYLTLARVLIAKGRRHPTDTALSQALILLKHWRQIALQLDFQGWLIEIQMLTALAFQAQGNMREALTTLGAALAQAEPEGYLRLFADEGQPMAHLLVHISTHTTASSDYIQRIQRAISSPQRALISTTQTGTARTLLEPLSGREREVLSLLGEGCSNQQIANHLVISLNTAKRHVKHILAKLGTTNRLGAVARARELHLL